mgnify:CR=1 FL=1
MSRPEEATPVPVGFTSGDADFTRQALIALRKLRGQLDAIERERHEPLAVIGLACRLPGAPDEHTFWRLLESGGDAIRPIPPHRWNVDYYRHPDPDSDLHVVHQAGLLDQVDRFDAAFFGISGREAQLLDPQQRLLLEVVWEAIENAGIPASRLNGSRTGVFVGTTTTDYLHLLNRRLTPADLDAYIVSGNTLNATAGRVAYTLGLQGPTIAMDTACSSSLVAVDRACRSVRDGECRLAIAAGVNLILGPEFLVSLARWGMLAPDGRCKTWDAQADGFVRAEGCGAVLIKRLSHALADGDRIRALIRGSAVNQDGRSSGFAVPNGLAQASVIRDALAASGIDPASVGYVEAHGTGTRLGDPIEMEALSAVYGAGRSPSDPLVVGAVKTNVGHLEAAAGVTGLIKTILALEHRCIPPNLHFNTPSPHIPWDQIAVRIPISPEPWPEIGGSRMAGISSFGFSGTNVHVIVEQAPATASPVQSRVKEPLEPLLLTLSARSPEALSALAVRYAERIDVSPAATLRPISLAASAGRAHMPHRLAVIGNDAAELGRRLRDAGGADGIDENGDPERGRRGHVTGSSPPGVAFLFTGQGAQYPGMGRALAEARPVFRAAVERCAAVIDPLLGRSLLEIMFADDGAELLSQTRYTQPALFALQWGLVELWRSWGVEPAVVLGHSVGEFAAACCAGVLEVEQAARLVTERGALMHGLPAGGAMAAVFCGESVIEARLRRFDGVLAIAGFNADEEIVVSGDAAAVAALREELRREGIRSEPLTVSHAFHSPLMRPVIARFGEVARSVPRLAPRLPVVSTSTGRLADESWGTAAYWMRQLESPVLYAQAIRLVAAQPGVSLAVEIGPHPVLTGLGRRTLPDSKMTWLPSLRRGRDDCTTILGSLADLYVQGAIDDWSGAAGAAWRARLDLPTYPFQRLRHWVDADRPSSDSSPGTSGKSTDDGGAVDLHPLLGALIPLACGETVYQVDAGEPRHRRLREHRLHGHCLWPASASIEMMLAAARDQCAADEFHLADVRFEEPLLLSEHPVRIQTVVRPDSHPAVALHRRSGDGTGHWSRFASAAAFGSSPAATEVDFIEARALCGIAVDAESFYDVMARRGADFGPVFRSLDRIMQGPRAAFGQVRSAETFEEWTDDPLASACLLHPVLLDGVLQLVSVAIGESPLDGNRLLVRGELSRLSLHRGHSGQSGWGFARLRDADRSSPVVADLSMWDDEGHLVASLEGLRFERVTARAVGLRHTDLLTRATYAWQWQPIEVGLAWPADGRRWLLVGDEGGFTGELADSLRELGAEVQVAPLSAAFAPSAGQAPAEAVGQSSGAPRTGGWHPALEAFLRRERSADAQTTAQVVFLGALDLPAQVDPVDPLAALRPVIDSSLALIQACAGTAGAAPAPRLWWLIRSGIPVGNDGERGTGGRPISPLAGSLWGLCRVLRCEHPEFSASLVDLDERPKAKALATLMSVSPIRESQFALRADSAWVARIGPTDPPRHPVAGLQREGVRFGWTAPAPGSIEDLVCAPHPVRDPGAMDVTIDVRASGLNFRDVLWALGMVPGVGTVLGWECAGVVRAVGLNVHDLRVGDEVIAIAPGSFASDVTVARRFVAPKPAGLDMATAASLPVAFLTAIYGLEHLGRILTPGRPPPRVLIHSGTGGVGMAAIQVARRAGAQVFATAGSESRRERLRMLGVEHVFDSRNVSFRDQVLAATSGEGVDIVLNSLAGPLIPASLDVLAPGGRFLEMGKRDIWSAEAVARVYPHVEYRPFDLGDEMRSDPALAPALFETLSARLAAGELRPLPVQSYSFHQLQEAMRTMMQAGHVGKLVLQRPDGAVAAPPCGPVRGDASYLVTGGHGALGLAVAHELVRRGARHLILVGRRSPGPDVAAQLARLRDEGVEIRSVPVDVADATALRALLDETSGTMPALRGVIHAAGVLDDGVLINQTWSRFSNVLAPKLQGAVNLDRLTRTVPLDFFVLFSAAAGWVGAPGQGNYASANTALDVLVQERLAARLPATSIAWGRWEGPGMAASRDWDSLGAPAIDIEQGLDALFELIGRQSGACAVLPLDWRRYLGHLYHDDIPACFDRVLDAQAADAGQSLGGDRSQADERGAMPARSSAAKKNDGASTFVRDLTGLPLAQRTDQLMRRLEALVRRVAAIPAGQPIDPDCPLRDLGVDSLMTVELRNAIGKALGVNLAATVVFDHPSLNALTRHVMVTVPGLSAGADAAPAIGEGGHLRQARMIEAVRELSEDEAEAQLLRELSGQANDEYGDA